MKSYRSYLSSTLIKFIFVLSLIFSISLSPSAYAHKLGFGQSCHGTNCDHDHEAEVRLGPEVPLSQDEVQKVIHGSHEVLEGDHSASFLKRWVGAFDLKNKFIDSYRWGSAKSKDPRFKDLVIDSLFLFGLSHLLEVASGPIMLGVGSSQDWPEWVMYGIGVGGATISVPGLDPLCILIFGTYAKSENFRKGIGYVRAAIMKPINKTWSAIGMGEALTNLKRLKNVSKLEGLNRISKDENGFLTYYYLYPLENPLIEIAIHSDADGTYLQSVAIHKNSLSELNRGEFKAWLKPLGWNARNLITKVLDLSVQEKDLYEAYSKLYVKSVKQYSDKNFVELSKHSVSVRSETCSDALAAKE